MKTLLHRMKPARREVLLEAYHNGGTLSGWKINRMMLYHLRKQGWIKRPDEVEPERLGRNRDVPKALGGDFVLSAAGAAAVETYLLNSTD